MQDQKYAFSSQYCSWTRCHSERHRDCALYIYTLLTYTNTRSIEAEQQVCSKTPTPKVGLQNLRAYKMWILSNSWTTGWRMQLET